MKSYLLLFIINMTFILVSYNCTSKKESTTIQYESKEKKFPAVVINEFSFNDSIQEIPNSDESLIMFLKDNNLDNKSPNNKLTIVIYDPNKQSVIYKSEYNNSKVQWESINELLLIRYTGIKENPVTENRKTYIINVLTGEIKENTNNTQTF